MKVSTLSGLTAALVLSATGSAQSFNIDVGPNLDALGTGAPTGAYAGAAGQVGAWSVVETLGFPALVTLDDLNGLPSSASVTSNQTSSFTDFPLSLTLAGDDKALMSDGQTTGPIGPSTTWTVSGLVNGAYTVYTYCWSPNANTEVTVMGSPEGLQTAGMGGWTMSPHVEGDTYTLHTVNVTDGTLTLMTTGDQHGVVGGTAGTINGFQLVGVPTGDASFCFGDGTGTACPCGNSGSVGNGCENSFSTGGGNLSAAGVASISSDTLVLSVSGLPNTAPGLYFQGTSQENGGLGVAFGDGLRCVGGSVIRLGTKTSSGGASSFGSGVGSDPLISVKGAVGLGDTRHYQTWYRNSAAFCTAQLFNLTNALTVTWGS